MAVKIQVVFYSMYGHVYQLAEAEAAGAREVPGVDVMLLPGFHVYARVCGGTLARAHARSGDRIAIASYLGRGDVFDRAVLAFSEAYAEQNDRDYKTLVDAAATGRIHGESSY